MLHKNYCQQHDHAAAFSLLNHFHFESFSSHIIYNIYICIYIDKVSYIHSFFVIFNSNVFSVLHAKHFEVWKSILWNWSVNCLIARFIKWCDMGVHSESIFPFSIFFLKKTVFLLFSLSFAYRRVNQLRDFW